MVLPSSGPISAANINVELGKAYDTTFSMNATDIRALTGRTTANTIHSFSNFYGRSSVAAILYSEHVNQTVSVGLGTYNASTWVNNPFVLNATGGAYTENIEFGGTFRRLMAGTYYQQFQGAPLRVRCRITLKPRVRMTYFEEYTARNFRSATRENTSTTTDLVLNPPNFNNYNIGALPSHTITFTKF